MYIDNTNFYKETPYTKQCLNEEGKLVKIVVSSKYYLVFKASGLEAHEDFFTIIRIFELLSTDKDSLLESCVHAIFSDYPFINRIYTKLDLDQSFKQVRANKYFKTFIGKKQPIKEVADTIYNPLRIGNINVLRQ
jgi:hypothetical protein